MSADLSRSTVAAQYDPAAVEVPLYQRWLAAGYFRANERRVLSGERKPFSIVLPPPNVTGNLHIGHALDHTLMDVLARWHRMSGEEVLWLPGMDHAGIATQSLVEQLLAVDGKSRHDFGRELFVDKVWDWKRESGGAILGQMKRLGDSVDWDRERFTLDDGLSAAVQTVFKQLFDQGLIYRAERIINWCPGCLTALSDIEVDHSEDAGELVSIRYDSVELPGESVVVATTRVETMLGDTGIAVHPDDERYAHLVGTRVELPLVGRHIPIVADEHVDPAFGTGAVKVTPAHDPNDFQIGLRHDLAALTMLSETADIVGTGTPFDGMNRFQARAAVKEALRAQGRVVAEKIPYLHAVGHCSRSDDVVEPRLSLQWFVSVAPLAKAAGDAVREGRTTIHPPEMAARYFDWIDNMHDWTISRQLWWGHRIPVWYSAEGEIRCVGPDEPPPGEGWVQDPDVLDTWFSSGLWPFSTMGWPERTATFKAFYPTSVLVTGYDILFFWVARMMMFASYLVPNENGHPSVPFRTVALHGLVRDQFGKKMSKSKGNGVDPLVWIDRYGADAVRFTLARGANPGADQAIAEEWVAGSGRFCTKLFNAVKFAMLNGAALPTSPIDTAALSHADRWVLDRLDQMIDETTLLLGDFQFGKAAEALYHFAWDEICDWYLEMAKAQIAQAADDPDRLATTRLVLGTVLDGLLKLLHPFVPFVTETLWTALTSGESLVIASWPTLSGRTVDDAAATAVAQVRELVTAGRRAAVGQGVRLGRKVLARHPDDWAFTMAVALLKATSASGDAAFAATVSISASGVVGAIELDMSSAVDVHAEISRLEKERAVAHKESVDTAGKLARESFTAKAPAAVVDKVRARADKARADIERLTARLAELGAVARPPDLSDESLDSDGTVTSRNGA